MSNNISLKFNCSQKWQEPNKQREKSYESILRNGSTSKKTPAFPFKRGSEQMIRKYYPKTSKIFWKGLLHKYQSPDADEIPNPNTRILARYKRDFFNSFSAYWNVEGREPAKLPQNLKFLTIHNGSQVLLKKLIQQNKKLRHIEFASFRDNLCSELVKSLRYCKNLCSITFTRSFPFISEKTIKSLRRSLGNTLQKVTIGERIGDTYNQKPKEFTRIMESIFQFPKLQEIKFGAMLEMDPEYFPVKKLQELQEKNIACNVKLNLPRGTSKAFLESIPEVKSSDYVRISMRNFWEIPRNTWDSKAFEKKRLQSLSKQVRDLDISALPDFHLSTLLQGFRETSNLELVLSMTQAHETDYSEIKELSNLKHLNIDIEMTEEEESFLSDLFENLRENVESHKKLEELIMRISSNGVESRDGDTSVIFFFHHCSKSLKKAYLEFQHSSEDPNDLAPFYIGLSKLENLQSLNLLLGLGYFGPDERIEELSEIMLKMKSLEEVDLGIEKRQYGEDPIKLTFPSWLKKLSLGMDTLEVPFDPSMTLWSLSNLTWLKLEFLHFNSPEWSKVIQDMDQLQKLEVLVLKQRFAPMDIDYIPQMKRRLDSLMKQCLNLRLVVFGSMTAQEVTLFRRDYPWSEVNRIVAEFSFLEHIKVGDIYHY